MPERTIQSAYFGEIPIPDELIDVFQNYQQNDEVQSGRLTYVADKTEYFIRRFVHRKNIEGKRLSIESIPVTINKFKVRYCEEIGRDFKISGNNVFMSGACWRLHQRELSGEDITDDAVSYEARIPTQADIVDFKKTYKTYQELFYST